MPRPVVRTLVARTLVARTLVLLLLVPALGACGTARRAAGAVGIGGAPDSAVAAAPADTTTGGRWYGYEGGLAEAEAAARTIEGATQYWQAVEGRWRTDADSGTFTAHFLDRRLRRVAITWGEGATTGTGAYTYDERARLFHYDGEQKRRTGRGRNARTTTTTYSIALDPTGTTSATRKAVGRRTQALTPEEVQEVVARERAARGAAVRALPRAQ